MSWRVRNGVIAAVGLLLLLLSGAAASGGTVGSLERRLLLAINGWPEWLYRPMFVFQQAGNLIIVIVVVIVLAVVLRNWRVAAAGLAAIAAKLVLERVVKAVVERQRPGSSIGSEVILRGRVSAHGLSFVSGHVILTVALAMVLSPYLPRRWRYVPWLLVVLNAIARMYVGAHNPLDIVGGVGVGLFIGGVINVILPPRPSKPATRVPTRAVTAGLLLLLLGACSSGEPKATAASTVLDDDAITVASFDFAESELLAELYSQNLEHAGIRVERELSLGSREVVAPALVAGLVEVVPEYAGTALQFHGLGRVAGSADAATTHEALADVLEERRLLALSSAPAEDANRFVVTRETADRSDVAALSDLAGKSGELRFGGPPECPDRPLCLGGLHDVYGLTFRSFVRLDTGGVLTRQALTDGQVDVALLFSTDPSLTTGEFVELADDRGLQPAENVTPVVRREVVERFGDRAVRAIDEVSQRLTTEDLRRLNGALREDGATVATVARAWREAKGLT